jgi:hypothetical protein
VSDTLKRPSSDGREGEKDLEDDLRFGISIPSGDADAE